MSIDPNAIIMVRWGAPLAPAYTVLDSIFAGEIFTDQTPDSRIDRYELEVLDPILGGYVNRGYYYETQAEFQAADLEDARVRVRAILRDETKTPWAYSGTFVLSMFRALFSDPVNAVFLSFI